MNENLKVALFDLDGLVFLKTELFSSRFSREYKVPMKDILPFFGKPFEDCLVGKSQIEKELPVFVKKWNSLLDVEGLIKLWLETEIHLDLKMKEEIIGLKNFGVKCFALSNQEKRKGTAMKKCLVDEKIFEENDIFLSCELASKKPDQEVFQKVYLKILEKVSVEKENVYFWDDSEINVNGATQFGFSANFFESVEVFSAQKKLIFGLFD